MTFSKKKEKKEKKIKYIWEKKSEIPSVWALNKVFNEHVLFTLYWLFGTHVLLPVVWYCPISSTQLGTTLTRRPSAQPWACHPAGTLPGTPGAPLACRDREGPRPPPPAGERILSMLVYDPSALERLNAGAADCGPRHQAAFIIQWLEGKLVVCLRGNKKKVQTTE